MKTFNSGLLVAILLISLPAFAEDRDVQQESSVKRNADGTVAESSHYSGTDSAGVAHTSETEHSTSKTWLGKDKTTTKTESVSDPKGLGNKTWKKNETTVVADKKGNVEKEVSKQSIDAAGTARRITEEADIDVDSDGRSKTIISREVVTDPKGLGNQTVAKTEETVRRAADGTVSKSVEKSVN